MKLSIKGLAAASAVLWGGAVFLVAAVNLLSPSYGILFLALLDSIYPGMNAGTGPLSVIVGTGYAVVDGAIAGALFAWLYNYFLHRLAPKVKETVQAGK